jgi:hypothetical protein
MSLANSPKTNSTYFSAQAFRRFLWRAGARRRHERGEPGRVCHGGGGRGRGVSEGRGSQIDVEKLTD